MDPVAGAVNVLRLPYTFTVVLLLIAVVDIPKSHIKLELMRIAINLSKKLKKRLNSRIFLYFEP